MPYGTNMAIICPYLRQISRVTVELSNVDFDIDTMEKNIYFSIGEMNDSGLTTDFFIKCDLPYLVGIIILTQLIEGRITATLPVIQNSYLITIWHFF